MRGHVRTGEKEKPKILNTLWKDLARTAGLARTPTRSLVHDKLVTNRRLIKCNFRHASGGSPRAFAQEKPPIAVNLLHPRPSSSKLTSYLLPLVPFSEWLEKLESNAKDLSKECISSIAAWYQASQLHVFDRSIQYCDRASGEMGVEVAGMASCVTAVTERVSPTDEGGEAAVFSRRGAVGGLLGGGGGCFNEHI
ncbi:hypothetical protein EV424DRAFT_1553715 [Suillus variegatus]|nr:hypothetical protein EV424DRAFT_1553715 [Suillus variegatus]